MSKKKPPTSPPNPNRSATPYRISLQDMETQKEIWSSRTSRLRIISIVAFVVAVIGFCFFALFAWTPLHNILPGYLNHEDRKEIVDNALRVDSLSRELALQEQYMVNIARILTDDITVDSIAMTDSIAAALDSAQGWTPDILAKSSPESEEFSRQYEESERFNLTMLPQHNEGILFYPPISGNVIKAFDPMQGSFGITMQAGRNASVAAVLDGAIVAVTSTIADGYVVVVQHNNNYMSIYRNIGECLRQVGERVEAGERIALVGTALNNEVQYELWHTGVALDPQKYIVF